MLAKRSSLVNTKLHWGRSRRQCANIMSRKKPSFPCVDGGRRQKANIMGTSKSEGVFYPMMGEK